MLSYRLNLIFFVGCRVSWAYENDKNMFCAHPSIPSWPRHPLIAPGFRDYDELNMIFGRSPWKNVRWQEKKKTEKRRLRSGSSSCLMTDWEWAVWGCHIRLPQMHTHTDTHQPLPKILKNQVWLVHCFLSMGTAKTTQRGKNGQLPGVYNTLENHVWPIQRYWKEKHKLSCQWFSN